MWRGSAFDCLLSGNAIVLFHVDFNNTNGAERTCNREGIVGRSIQANPYISQLTILAFNSTLNGKSVECVYDGQNGSTSIGMSVLMISGNTIRL